MLTQEIIIEINHSFKNITLDNGVGYFQSCAIDSLVIDDSKDKFEQEVKKDIRFQGDWHLLLAYLTEHETDYFAYAFMDYKGIRYLLPCLLILEYTDILCSLIPELLNHSELWEKNIWQEILTHEQRNTIINVFNHWNDENISVLQSYGMTKKNANSENQNNSIFQTLTAMKMLYEN